MADRPTWDDLRELAAADAAGGCALSVYLALDPSETPTARDLATRVNALLNEAERREDVAAEDLDHARREALRADRERLQSYLEDELDRSGLRGLAVFASSPAGVWRVFRLADEVADRVEVAKHFALAPLVPVLERSGPAVVAVAGREQGRVYGVASGRVEQIADRFEDQPRRHDQGGWSQARQQRFVDEQAAAHLRDVADVLERTLGRLRGAPLVLAVSDEARGAFEDMLGPAAEAALAGWITVEAHAGPDDVWAEARPVVEEWRRSRERELLDRLHEELGRDGRAAAGWPDVIAAAPDARIDLLVYGDRATRDCWECPQCGRPALSAGSCPLDGTPLERRPRGALELALRQTLLHGGEARALDDGADLPDRVAALLRF